MRTNPKSTVSVITKWKEAFLFKVLANVFSNRDFDTTGINQDIEEKPIFAVWEHFATFWMFLIVSSLITIKTLAINKNVNKRCHDLHTSTQ